MTGELPLSKLRRGDKAVVAALPGDRAQLGRLLAFGILPGTAVRVLQTFPAYVLAVGHTQIALDKGLAVQVKVARAAAEKPSAMCRDSKKKQG